MSKQFASLVAHVCQVFDAFCYNEAQAKEPNKRYLILSSIGAGATATVFRLRRLCDDVMFALKVVNLEGASGPAGAHVAEVSCLLSCDFFTIVKCHEEFTAYGAAGRCNPLMIALVLDFCGGGDLHQEINGRSAVGNLFDEGEACTIFAQVVMAVHHIHGRHMLHRDIKTANVLLSPNGLVHLGDFGSSKQFSGTVSEDVAKTFCGTPYIIAPEIWAKQAYSAKADLFSLGVVLYELLSLKRPFDGACTRT